MNDTSRIPNLECKNFSRIDPTFCVNGFCEEKYKGNLCNNNKNFL